MFVVGIGDNIDKTELQQIASSPANVFTVKSYDELPDKPRQIRTGICIGIAKLCNVYCTLCCYHRVKTHPLNKRCFYHLDLIFYRLSINIIKHLLTEINYSILT